MSEGIHHIRTGDGSSSLYHESLNETYHSTHGAIQESMHVFIKHGLLASSASKPDILEYGFGTGLNVILTAIEADKIKKPVRLTSLEAFPLDEKLIKQLNYPELLVHDNAGNWLEKIHVGPWGSYQKINDLMSLKKVRVSFENFSTDEQFDIIYYDAFAPSRQPELWTMEQLGKVVSMLGPDGIFVTYSARGQLKRDLAALNMKVETLEGPPGKKEMVRAIKQKNPPI